MCGRYLFYDEKNVTMYRWIKAAKAQMSEQEFASLSLSEVFPGQKALIITPSADGRAGLRPALWGYPLKGKLIINARSETLERSPFFAGSVRCVVPASGYYEWTKKPRIRYFFTLDSRPVYLGAVCRVHEDGLRMVIVTENASSPQSEIHDRQPLLFTKENAGKWCRNNSLADVLSLSEAVRRIAEA